MSLANLPSETLSLILEFLADEDLATLLLAQRVCTRFKDTIGRILKRQHTANHTATSPFLQHQFHILFNAELSVPKGGSARMSPDPELLFHKLPWVASRRRNKKQAEAENGDMKGSPHLRPEASWRRLSVAWAIGGPDIKNLDVTKFIVVYGGTSGQYAQLDIPPGPGGEEGVLTMGLLYDLLASQIGHLGRITRSWEFIPRKRLESYDDWMRLRNVIPYPDKDAIMDLLVEDKASALLFVTGFRGCTGVPMRRRYGGKDEDEKVWEPSAMGDAPVVLSPWQGPVLPLGQSR
ncbi:hypothetical protein F4776DRAFT_289376 [Hypoxylon sp. NC0597]|nr:hypothetical protein F4776DRAFT_289376 [Hypoxylon sp. NC0597]